MSRSWGHAVHRLADAEMARMEQMAGTYYGTCRALKCQEPVTHITQYSYVTGRHGRTSWSERRVCTGHAEKFAAKHGIEITEGLPPREHAMQRMLRTAGFPKQED